MNLKKASTSYLIGSMFNKGIVFLTVPIFTRLLSTSDYGIVNTYNSWVSILAIVLGFALHTGIRIAFVDYKEEMQDFLATTTTFTLVCGTFLSILFIVFLRLFHFKVCIFLIVACFAQSISSALIEDYSTYLMMRYKYQFRTVLMILPNFLSVVFSVLVINYVLKDNLYLGRIIPTSIIITLFGLLVCVLIYRNSRLIYKEEYLKYALNFSLPLVLHGIALNILSQSDRAMITWLADSSQTGIYSLVYNFSMVATVITTSFEGIWIPWFYGKLKEREYEEINIISKDYINLMTYCLIGVIMVGPEIVKLLASPSYWDGIKIIPPVVLSNFVIFAYSLYVNIEHYHKQTKFITINTVVAAVSNIILNLFFVSRFGYVAAAFTTLASYLISFVLHMVKSKILEKDLFPIYYFKLPLIELSVFTLLYYLFMNHMLFRWVIVFIFEIVMLVKEWHRIVVYFPQLEKKR